MIGVDLTGVFNVTKSALADLKAFGKGARIVNIASTAGLTGYAYVSAYCAAKHGVVGLTRALALELAKSGVTVNAVCPGFTDTPIIARSVEAIVAKTGRTAEAALSEFTKHNPQGVWFSPTRWPTRSPGFAGGSAIDQRAGHSGRRRRSAGGMRHKQFQKKCRAVFRPELRKD